MNTLDRYLFRTVMVYAAMSMAVLLVLGALFLFISEQGDIGVGNYNAGDALVYTLLNLPQLAFELLPIGAMNKGEGQRRPNSSTLKSRFEPSTIMRGIRPQRSNAATFAFWVCSLPQPPAT